MLVCEAEVKRCTKCGIVKQLSDYYYHSLRGKVVPHSECKICTIIMVKKYKETHPVDKERAKIVHDIYYGKNREKILNKCKLDYPEKKGQIAVHNKLYYQSHRDNILRNREEYRLTHKNEINAWSRKFYKLNPEKNKYARNKSKCMEYTRKRNFKIKTEVITYYGGGKCACVRCGFTDIRSLSIDHINGNGYEHRKNNRYVRGNHVYEWLKKNQFPLGYQTLCMNCQFIKRLENNECSGNKTRYF